MKASFVDTDNGIVLVVSHDGPHDSILMRTFVEQEKPSLLLRGETVGIALDVESRAGKTNK